VPSHYTKIAEKKVEAVGRINIQSTMQLILEVAGLLVVDFPVRSLHSARIYILLQRLDHLGDKELSTMQSIMILAKPSSQNDHRQQMARF
jgi:hypothetical protein